MRRAAIYTRVSTSEQTTENQACRLREVAARAGRQVVATYDETASGAASSDRRARRTLPCSRMLDGARLTFF